MTRGLGPGARPVIASLLLALPLAAGAAPRSGAPARPPPRPLPAPPTLPLIRVEAARDHLLVTQDVLLGRGEWTSGDIDAFIAFGSPGLPRAVDARLSPAAADREDTDDATPSEPIPIDRAFQRPAGARHLLGSPAMAGAVLHLREAAFRRATQPTGVARVRLRTLLDLPAPDVRTGREVVIRLGAYEGEPYALGSIEVASVEPGPWISRADAHLCGPDAAPDPLAVRLRSPVAPPRNAKDAVAPVAPVAPELSVRHATDDLCIRIWTASDP